MVLESVGCTGAGWGSWTAEDRIGVSGDLKGDHQVYRREPDPAQEDGITNNHSDFANEVGTLQDVWKRAGGGGEAWSVGQPHLRVCVWRGGWARIIFGHCRATNTVQDRT
jgi:hypothetical protein